MAASLFSDTNNLLTTTTGGNMMAAAAPPCFQMNGWASGGGGDLDLVVMNNDDGLREWNDDGTAAASSFATVAPPHPHPHPPAAAPFEKQSADEVGFFLQLQNERLKLAIHNHRNEQLSTVLNGLIVINHSTRAAAAAAMMRKNEADLILLTQRTKELEHCLRKAEADSEAWRRLARESEAMVIGLLEQVATREDDDDRTIGTAAEDAESVCDGDDHSGGAALGWCRWCRVRRSSVVFLPCKHLCACVLCGAGLSSCPVCQAVKRGCIQVLLT